MLIGNLETTFVQLNGSRIIKCKDIGSLRHLGLHSGPLS